MNVWILNVPATGAQAEWLGLSATLWRDSFEDGKDEAW